MKQIISSILLLIQVLLVTAQNGSIKGTVTDAKTKESLIGTTVLIKGTTQGTITDFDGNYTIENLTPGNYILLISFISYKSQELGIEVKAGEETRVDVSLSPATLEIEGVQVVAKAIRESEAMLLLDQKNAAGIKESIGANRLSELGVSDAAGATTKISGVNQSEGSGDVYIRGLGDRYLSTTMNGLPIPSDDVDKKNIDLNLFSTDLIKNVGISKTFAVSSYGDQSSGTVDIGTKTTGEKITLAFDTEANTNVLSDGIFSTFKATQNFGDVGLFGIYKRPFETKDAIRNQSWNTGSRSFPLGTGGKIMAGKKLKLFNNDFSAFFTASHDVSSEYNSGVFKKYRSNVLNNSFTDAEKFSTNSYTTGLLNLTYDFNDRNSLYYNSLFVSKTEDELYEQGRNGEGYVFDQDPQEEGAFVRDQNLKTTFIFIHQLLGTHNITDNNLLKWGTAYNTVHADEPNRIRNEVNLIDENTVQFAHVGDFQQRKSFQRIEDSEINGFVADEIAFVNEENNRLKLLFGGNFRSKQRDFQSLFVGVRAKGVQVKSIDNLDQALLDNDLYSNGKLIVRDRAPDLYDANLNIFAAFINLSIEKRNFSGTLGARFESANMDVNWDVANYVGRLGNVSNNYNNALPSVNLKYAISEKNSLRFAASKTVTLPEFKELSPFEYVSPTGRVTKGNPDLKHSNNYNLDLKWELFPSSQELVSVTGFYKQINDPINLAQARGSSGNFVFENTGERAHVYGIELETRFTVLPAEQAETPGLNVILNATKMWFNQDLTEEFQYNNKTATNLQGAPGFILNGALSYSNNKKNEFVATLTGNYSSNKILALGAPEDFENSTLLFNNEIVEKGFTTIDLVVSKELSEKIKLSLSGKNLLNPKIEQTQDIKPLSGDVFTEVVSSYKKGISVKLGLSINLN